MKVTHLLLLFIAFAVAQQDVWVGINYFAGWWQGAGDKWYRGNHSWQPEFPERVPLLGSYNTQPTVDAEILAAASHGVKYFQMLYYDNYPKEREPNSRYLNRGITNFVASPNAHMMSFFISWCNTYPMYGLNSMDELDEMIHHDWLPAFQHPSYLRVEGRLVFKLINAKSFLVNCNNSAALVKLRLDHLRGVVERAGLGKMWIGGGLDDATVVPDPKSLGYDYDWVGLYASVPHDLVPLKVYPWDSMRTFERSVRAANTDKDAVPFVPFMMAGWDARPWGGESRPVFTFPTSEEWIEDLQEMKRDLGNSSLHLGFPLPSDPSRRQPAFNIYAWNEFGEGGIMAPTKGWNYTRLEGIRSVFQGGNPTTER